MSGNQSLSLPFWRHHPVPRLLPSSTHASSHHLLQEGTSLSLLSTSKVTFTEF